MSSKYFFTRFSNKKYPSQRRKICQICGKTRGYKKAFGLSRVDAIFMFNEGLIPGVKKSSS